VARSQNCFLTYCTAWEAEGCGHIKWDGTFTWFNSCSTYCIIFFTQEEIDWNCDAMLQGPSMVALLAYILKVLVSSLSRHTDYSNTFVEVILSPSRIFHDSVPIGPRPLLYPFPLLTLPDLRSSYVSEDPAHVEFCESRSWVYIWRTVYYYNYSCALDRDLPRHYRPAAFVFAQQYSSSTFVSLRFCVLKEKFGGRLTRLRI